MNDIKFVYFDIGGVLVDHISALKTVAKKLSVTEEFLMKLFVEFDNEINKGEMSWKDFEIKLYGKKEVKKRLSKTFIEEFVDNFKKIKEIHEIIFEVRENYKIGILSNAAEDIFKLVKSKNLIPNINWDSIIISAELKTIKPEKKIFEIALNKINYKPREIFFIDDNVDNIKTAKMLGWQTILFETNNPDKSVKQIKEILKIDN